MKFLAALLMLVSLNTFAGETQLSGLSCISEMEPNFELNITFDKKIDSINDTGFAQSVGSSATMRFLHNGERATVSVGRLTFSQGPAFYGYEMRFQTTLLQSKYQSYLSIQPRFRKSIFSGPTLIGYSGVIEINAQIDNSDRMIIKTEDVNCFALPLR